MAELETSGATEGSTSTGSESGNGSNVNSSIDDGAGVVSETPNTGTEGGTNNDPSATGEQEVEFVKGDDGNDYIPRKAFEERMAKMAAQKHDAWSSLLEAAKNDPNRLQELKQTLGLEAQAASEPEPKEASAFDNWLAPLPPEHQAHYRGFAQSIASEFENYVEQRLEKAMQPVLSFIGKQEVKGFETINKDFGKYKTQIQDLLQNGRAKNLEDAYILASYTDKLKSVSSATSNANNMRKTKMNAPLNTGRGDIRTSDKKVSSLREAINLAAKETGYLNQ